MMICLTRFGEISPLRHNFKRLWQILSFYYIFGKILNILCANFLCYKWSNIFFKNLAIWSHWWWYYYWCHHSSWVRYCSSVLGGPSSKVSLVLLHGMTYISKMVFGFFWIWTIYPCETLCRVHFTHCNGKYQCMAALQFFWIGFHRAKKYVMCMK